MEIKYGPRAPQYLHVKQNGGGKGAEQQSQRAEEGEDPSGGSLSLPSPVPARPGEGPFDEKLTGASAHEEGAHGKPRNKREQLSLANPEKRPLSREGCQPV